jgi:hypothetical protein
MWRVAPTRETPIVEDPDAGLQRALMEEYLSEHGHSFEDLASFDDDDRQRLMLEAAAYAALRLAERAYPPTRTQF